MAETEPAVTIPEVEAPTFDPITIDLKIPGLGASISSERKAALSAGADLSEDFMPLPQVIEHHTKKLGITESQLREAAGAQGFDLDYFVGEIGKKGRSTGGVLRELEAQKTPALTTSPEGRKTEARGLQIAKYGYGRAEKGEGRTVEETGVVAEELKDLVRGRDLTYRFLDYDDDIEGVDAVVKPGSAQFEDVVQTTGQLLDESTEVGRMRAELVEQWGQNIILESGLQKYVDPMSAYYTERQAQKRGLSEFDPEYDKLYHRSRARALREVALMKTSGKWVAPTWMSWEKIFPDDRVSQSDDPWLKKAWDRGSRVRVELVGTDNRGAPVFQLTNPVWHIFEMSDVVQSAIAGSLTAAGDEDDPRGIMDRLSGGALEGIENRQTFMDAALATDMARDSTAAAYVLGTVGFAATILTPDLLFGVGTVGRATKKTYRAISNVAKLNSKARVAVPGMKAAALKRAQAEEVLAQAEAAFTAGRLDEAKRFLEESLPLFEEAEKAERNVRKVGPALMDQVDTMDATLYTKAKELTPEITPEGGRKVGDIIGGRFGHLDEAVHPSVRRRAERVRQGGKSLTPYNEYYDTSRIVRGLITAVDDIGTGTFRHTRDVLKKTAYLRSKAYTILKKRGLNRGAIADDPDTMKLWSEFHDYIDDAANVPLMLSKPDQWVAEASKRFSKLINEAAEAAPGGRTLAVETMGQELEVAAAVAGRIKAAQIDNKGRLLSSLAGAVRSVRANTETRAVALLFIRQQVAKAALIPTKPVMVKAATKFEEFRTLTPMARRYLKQIRKVFHNITEAQAQAAARMMDMRAHSAARASDSTVEAWYQSHFPKEAFKSKEEFLARWTAATESQTQEGLEVPAELVKELKNATKAVEKAEKALKKAQDAVGDAAAIKDSKAVVAAEKVFDEAKAAKDAADEALAAATRAQMATAQAAADARTALKNARRGTVEEVIEESAAAPKAAPSAPPAQAAVKPDTKAIKAAEEKLAAAKKELDDALTSAPKSIDTADKELLKLQDDLSRGSETALPEIVSRIGPGWTRVDLSTGQVAGPTGDALHEGYIIFKNAADDILVFTSQPRLPASISTSLGFLTRDATSIASGVLVPGLDTAFEISLHPLNKGRVVTGSAKSIDDAAVKAAQAELDALKAVAPKAAPAAAPKVEAPPAAAARKTVRRKVAADPQVVTAAQKTFDDANEVKKAATKAKSQATKDVKKAAKQRDKAQVALETATAAAPKAKKADTIALLGAHEKLVKAKTRLEAAESTAAKFLDDAQDVAISDAIDFTTTAVLNPGAFVRRLAQLKKVGVVKQVDVGPKGLSEGYKPGTKNVHRDVIKDSFAHAQKTIDEAAEGTTFTLDDLLLPEFKALLVRELRLDVREPPLLNAMAAMADEGITDAFKVSPADIKRALGDEDILFQRGAAGQTDWEMKELGEGLVELTSAEIRAGRAAGEAPAATLATDVAKGESYFDPGQLFQLEKLAQKSRRQESLIYMSPDEFLSLAKPLIEPTPDKAARVAGMLERGEKFPSIPHLLLDESGQIYNHEGRHRAMALKKLGVKKMPVNLHSNDIRWNEQLPGGEAWYYKDNLPKQLIGEDGKTTIKSPFHTEGPNRGKPLPEYSGAPRAPEAPAAVMGGGLVFKMDGNTLRVQSSELPEAMRGQGIGQEMYIRALKHAQEKGFDFASDVAPSPDAIATYERLIEQGVPLTRKTVEAADGKMVQQFVATADDLADASLDAARRGDLGLGYIDKRLLDDPYLNLDTPRWVEDQIDEGASTPRVAAAQRLKKILRLRNDGQISEVYASELLEQLARQMDEVKEFKKELRSRAEVVRGADIVMEKLIRARRRNEIEPGVADLALWLINKNPDIAEGLAISIRRYPKEMRPEIAAGTATAAQYNITQRLLILFKKGFPQGAPAVHEILHHTERMMPVDVQAGIRRAWAAAITRELKTATPEQSALLEKMLRMEGTYSGEIKQGFKSGVLDSSKHYHLVNPSEFWAVNASRIIEGRYAVTGGWVATAKQWLTELIEKMKGLVGVQSDAAVLRGLKDVLAGDGTFVSRMLLDRPGTSQAIKRVGMAPTPRAPGAPAAGVVETATDARVLYQEAPEGIKGATQFLEDGRSFIYALDGADFSTFVHEFGHVMRRDLGDKGMDAVTDWVKSKGVQVTHRGGRFIGDAKAVEEAEELFARGFEKYIMEGKTPQVGLKATFEKMKEWMVDIYRGVRQAEEMGEVVNLEISPALRKVFDGLLQESEPKRSLLPRTLELLRRELAGPTRSGSQVDAVAEIVSELRRTGGHDISQEDILEQIVAVQTGKKEFIELPGPVYLHGGAHGVDEAATKIGAEGRRFPTGKSKFTVEEIGQLQAEMTTSSLLLKQLATKVPMTARSQAIQEMRPSEMIDNWMAPRDSAILNLARNWMIGGDPIADMRGLKPEVRARILSGSRLVEQAIGDTAKFIEDGDFEGLFALLSGGLVRHSATGRQALSSGHDMMASAATVINRVIDSSSGSWWSKTGPNNEALVADSVVMKGGERAYDAVAGFFDKIGGTASTRTIAELLRDPDYVHVSNALRGLISGTKKSILGDMFEAAGIDAALKNPPRDIKVMEAIFYVMGVSRRDGKKFVDTLADPESVSHSQAQVVALYTELRVVFGTDKAAVRDGAILANRIMSLVAGHGMAEKAQLRWIELGIAADENTMKAFKGWVNGEAIDNPEMLARVEQLYQVMGYGPNFQQIAMLEGITGYVPEAARRKLADALARAMDPDVTGKWTGDILEQVGGGMATGGTAWSAQRSFAFTYRYMKTRMVRGHYVLKSRYFWMNTMDHFNQMALVAGYRPAIVSTMRLLPQNILANPISQVVLTGIQKAGYEGAPEKVRSILTAAGNKGADWASTILRSSKWRVDLNDIMEAGGKDIRTGKMRPATVIIGGRVYGTLDLRQTMLEEAVFSSFDTSQLGVKIKKTANQWLERARTLEVDPQTGRAIVGERSQTIAQMLDPRTLSRISEDIAEGWAERERAGAVVTLIEMGLDPRTACRVTIEALYDYAGSMSKWDRHILMNLFFPFWAFQKNANRQILDTVFSPAGAYRLGVMRRAYTQGSEVLSSLLYQNTVDEFGLDYNNMDSTTRRQYDMMRYMLVEEYGTMDKVPLEVKQDIRGWLAGVITSRALQDGKLRALPELKNFLLKVGRLQLSDYYVAEPDAKFQRFYRQGRPGLRVPYPLQASTKKYVDLLRMEDRDAPFTTIFLPEPMYEAAFKHMGYTIASLVMAMQQLDSFAGVNLLTDEDDGTSGVSFLDPLLEVADPSRMMIVPQLAEALDIKTMAYPTALHPIIGVAAESANFDVLVLESTDDALAEISAIRDAEEAGEEPPEKAGVIRDPRYYLMPGMLQLVYSNSPLMELNRVLLQMERTPMEQRGGLRGDLVKWARSFLGLETEEVYKDRAIKFTRSAAEKEIGSKKTKEKIKKGGAVRRRDDGPRR